MCTACFDEIIIGACICPGLVKNIRRCKVASFASRSVGGYATLQQCLDVIKTGAGRDQAEFTLALEQNQGGATLIDDMDFR